MTGNGAGHKMISIVLHWLVCCLVEMGRAQAQRSSKFAACRSNILVCTVVHRCKALQGPSSNKSLFQRGNGVEASCSCHRTSTVHPRVAAIHDDL